MTLVITIFVLVFITELISWIGQSVLLDFVSSVLLHSTSLEGSNVMTRHTPSTYEYSTHPLLPNKEISNPKS